MFKNITEENALTVRSCIGPFLGGVKSDEAEETYFQNVVNLMFIQYT